MRKDCRHCIHYHLGKWQVTRHIEHKDKNGEVWMLEPVEEYTPATCDTNPDAYHTFWETIKPMMCADVVTKGIECNCDLFEPTEIALRLDKLVETATQTLEILRKNDKH